MSGGRHIAHRLIVAVAGLALAASPAWAERIARVVDGDTVVTASGEKVRLMGFDAPEIRGKYPRERELARQATAPLRRLVGSGLQLERQAETAMAARRRRRERQPEGM